jgi:hypothetical protein
MADMMKNSSMQTAPKGSTPPRAMLNAGCVYHTCCGVTESAIHQYTCKVGCVRQNRLLSTKKTHNAHSRW